MVAAAFPASSNRSALTRVSILRGPLLPARLISSPGRRSASKLPVGGPERKSPAKVVAPLSLTLPDSALPFSCCGSTAS